MIKVERRRILGVFPATRITLSQPHVATRLANRVNGAVRGTRPLSRVDPHDAALVALVTSGGLKIVLSPAQTTPVQSADRPAHRVLRTHPARVAQRDPNARAAGASGG
jgi:hypothetical protein